MNCYGIPDRLTDHGFIQIGDLCMTSNPCQHNVKIDGESKVMHGDAIYSLFLERDCKVPSHFIKYKERVERNTYLSECKYKPTEYILQHELYNENERSVMRVALCNDKKELINAILDQSYNLTSSDICVYIRTSTDWKMFPYLYDNIAEDEQTRDLVIRAAEHHALPVLRFLDSKNVKICNALFFTKDFSKPSPTRSFMVEIALRDRYMISKGFHIIKLKEAKLYPTFIDAELVRVINYNIISVSKHKDEVIGFDTPTDRKDFYTTFTSNIGDIGANHVNTLTSKQNFIIDDSLMYKQLGNLCHEDLSNKSKFSLTIPKFYNSIKRLKIVFEFAKETKINNCIFTLNGKSYDNLEPDLCVDHKTIELMYADPIPLKFTCFSANRLEFKIDPEPDNWVKSILYEIDFEDMKNPTNTTSLGKVKSDIMLYIDGGAGVYRQLLAKVN